MEMNNQATIKIKRKNIIKVGILDENDKPTGEHLEFDLDDVELLLRHQAAVEQLKRNKNALKMSLALIDKKQNHEGKKLLSSKEEQKLEAFKKYYEEQMKAYDMFLGENGCKKILNGRKPYYNMFDDIDEMMEEIVPIIEKGWEAMEKDIKDKYLKAEEPNVLE